ATTRRLLESERSVLHFSGHTVVNYDFPLYSYLLMAPDAADGTSGMLLALDVASHRFDHLALVVLSTCESAAGSQVDGEGVVSMARMCLDAGAHAVVASLWPVSDQDGDLAVRVHREFRAGGDAAGALRNAQLQFLHERGLAAPVRTWAGFIVLGAAQPHH